MIQQQGAERINVGIFAHVDAGKTTTTEHILYESGRIRELGSVDTGTALTDSMDVERQRGYPYGRHWLLLLGKVCRLIWSIPRGTSIFCPKLSGLCG